MAENYELQVYPAQILRERALEVTVFDESLKEKSDAMLRIMYEYNGIGLAGNQAGIAQRIVVADLSPDQDTPRVFINPEIVEEGRERESSDEGCLSFPDIYEPVMRAKTITLKYNNLDGSEQEEEMCELMARCMQHEIDHLNGVVFVDRVSPVRKIGLKKKLRALGG